LAVITVDTATVCDVFIVVILLKVQVTLRKQNCFVSLTSRDLWPQGNIPRKGKKIGVSDMSPLMVAFKY
jgi:hypothetical protein